MQGLTAGGDDPSRVRVFKYPTGEPIIEVSRTEGTVKQLAQTIVMEASWIDRSKPEYQLLTPEFDDHFVLIAGDDPNSATAELLYAGYWPDSSEYDIDSMLERSLSSLMPGADGTDVNIYLLSQIPQEEQMIWIYSERNAF